MNEAVKKAADLLWQAEQEGKPCAPVRELIGDQDMALAYAVQSLNTKRGLEKGRRLIGRKIGLTAPAVQKQLGVDTPDFGMLFADMAMPDGEEIAFGRVMQPKIEGEVALVLGKPLHHERHTVADIIRATEFALPAIEIVGSRIANWDIRITDTIADNASSGAIVLGTRPVKLGALDLSACGMLVERAGQQVSSGAGAACMGNPLHAAAWLADVMVKMERPLQEGDVIMTGALGPMVAATPGDVFVVAIEGLGQVRAAFGKAAATGSKE